MGSFFASLVSIQRQLQFNGALHESQKESTYPSIGCRAIALGFSMFCHKSTLRCVPSRLDTSIRDVPESVQYSLSWIQSMARPPETERAIKHAADTSEPQSWLLVASYLGYQDPWTRPPPRYCRWDWLSWSGPASHPTRTPSLCCNESLTRWHSPDDSVTACIPSGAAEPDGYRSDSRIAKLVLDLETGKEDKLIYS